MIYFSLFLKIRKVTSFVSWTVYSCMQMFMQNMTGATNGIIWYFRVPSKKKNAYPPTHRDEMLTIQSSLSSYYRPRWSHLSSFLSSSSSSSYITLTTAEDWPCNVARFITPAAALSVPLIFRRKSVSNDSTIRTFRCYEML